MPRLIEIFAETARSMERKCEKNIFSRTKWSMLEPRQRERMGWLHLDVKIPVSLPSSIRRPSQVMDLEDDEDFENVGEIR